MSGFGTFLVLLSAVVSTVLRLKNPIEGFVKKVEGKTRAQVEKESGEWVEEKGVERVFALGCGLVCYIVLFLAFTWLIQPLIVIVALAGRIGNQSVAYATLAILTANALFSLWWGREGARAVKREEVEKEAIKKSLLETDVLKTPEEAELEASRIMKEKKLIERPGFGSRLLGYVRVAVFSIPTWYLWYLFLVGIHLL